MGGVISDSVIVSSRVLNVDLDDFVSRQDYDFDSFISSDDYDLDDFVTDGDYDFDSMLTKRDFDPDEYVTQTDLEDQMDGFDPDDYVRCDDFDPDEYIMRHDLESELADCGFQQLNPDDYVSNDEFHESLNGYKKSIHLDFANLEKKLVTPTQHEVISFLTKLTSCASDYCTEALQEQTSKANPYRQEIHKS